MDNSMIKSLVDELTEKISAENITITEGSASTKELKSLADYASKIGAKKIVEIGFNAGFSSAVFLANNPGCTVTSFDIGDKIKARNKQLEFFITGFWI